MAIIGDLEIRLRADIARLSQDMNGARREVGGAMRNIESSVNLAKNALIGLGVAFGLGGIASMMTDVRRAAVDIERMAAMAGSSTDEFQKFAAGAKTVGMDLNKFSDIIKDTQDKIGDFLITGGGEMKDFFETIAPKVGVTADMFKYLSGPQALQLYYTTLEKAGVGQKMMITQMEAIASDSSNLAPLLANGGAAFKRMGEEAAKSGLIMSDGLINASKIVDIELRAMKSQLTGIGNTIAEGVMPEIAAMAAISKDSLAAGFQAVSVWVLDNKEKLLGMWDAAKLLGAEVWAIVSAAAALAVGIARWALEVLPFQTALESVGLMVAGLRDGVTFLGAIFAAIGGIIYEVVLTPLRLSMEVMAKIQGFFGNNDRAEQLSKTAAGIKEFAEAGGKYADDVMAKFARGDTAVARFAASVGKSTRIVLDQAPQTRDALKALGDGAMQSAEAAKKALKAEEDAYKAVLKIAQERGDLRNKEYDDINAYLQTQQEGYNAAVKGSRDALAAAQDEYDQFGLSKSQIAEITLLRMQDQLAATNGTGAYATSIQQQIDMQRELIAVMGGTESKQDGARNDAEVSDIAIGLLLTSDRDDMAHADRMNKLAINHAAIYGSEVEANLLMEAEVARHELHKADIRAANNIMSVGLAGDASGQLYEIMKKAGAEQSALGKALFLATKALAVAEIIMNTERAASAAMATTGIFGIPIATMIRATGYTNASLVAGLAIAEASAENGYDIPAGVNPVTQLHEKEMVLPQAQANVIRNIAKNNGSDGANSMKPINVNVSVDAKGSSVEGDDSQSKQLGAMIGNAVRSILIQEQRPGGMLA